ncbi:MAG: His/Gly/Thr/Pro-type tRNA ligase C-terminal domain-containing protein, partial [Salinarchaeum sp.]
LPITDENLAYAESVAAELEDRGIRVSVNDRDATVERKIRGAHEDRVPYQVIVGDDEESAGTISVRDRQEQQTYDVDPETFYDHLEMEIEQRRIVPTFL